MILSCNVRGLNKSTRHMEISADIKKLQVSCVALLETRVKEVNKDKIRRQFGSMWDWLDNYTMHINGRIWLLWQPSVMDIRLVQCSDQYMHCEVLGMDGKFQYWLTIIYAHNQLDCRRKLWQDLIDLSQYIQGAWLLIGDYNNVLKIEDRIGGNSVHAYEFQDLSAMMDTVDLFEHDTIGNHFTWTNKHVQGVIYSRIDRALCNQSWFTQYPNCKIEVLDAHISDHNPLLVQMECRIVMPTSVFKFINCVTESLISCKQCHRAGLFL